MVGVGSDETYVPLIATVNRYPSHDSPETVTLFRASKSNEVNSLYCSFVELPERGYPCFEGDRSYS